MQGFQVYKDEYNYALSKIVAVIFTIFYCQMSCQIITHFTTKFLGYLWKVTVNQFALLKQIILMNTMSD